MCEKIKRYKLISLWQKEGNDMIIGTATSLYKMGSIKSE